MKKRGLIQVYTGDGKGKTTACVGLAARARGQGMKVCYVYFHKEPARWNYGEHRMLKRIGVDVFGFAERHPHFYKDLKPGEVRRGCLKGLKFIKGAYRRKYGMLIMDEINIALRDGFLKEKEVIGLLKTKPASLELVLSGRGATKKLIEIADLVSRIENVKHPYDSGVKRRKGIEY